ncbi:MAG TPA: DUF2914 domain-containing protein [Kofleriaceae bacterium]|nr:DUF2914 domain-containing protein [Kofleriaceae bacterium]
MRHRSIASFTASIITAAGLTVGAAGFAPAALAQPAAAAAAAASAEVKAAKGVEKREPVEPGDTFAAGTKVWVWSRIAGANGTTVKHVWKKDDKVVWTATLKVGSVKWTTSSRHQCNAGAWSVDVVGEDGTTLGTTTFTVQ